MSIIHTTERRDILIPHPHICLCTLFTPEIKNYATETTLLKEDYCTQHGYDFAWATDKLDDRPPQWSKILIMLDRIEIPRYDWVVWMDADSIIMNFDIKWHEVIKQHSAFEDEMLIESDDNGLNTGVFAVRASAYMYQVFTHLYSMDQFINHKWFEQGAVHHLFETDKQFRDHVKIVQRRTFNSYSSGTEGLYQPGDFILHTPGDAGRSRTLNRAMYGLTQRRRGANGNP